MKNNLTCKHCGNEFAYRKGKIYCSQSCKTMAHREKANGVTTINEVPGEKYHPERKSFFLSDFAIWEQKPYYSFPIYCFLIKNQPESQDPYVLGEIATALCSTENFDNHLENSNHPICKEYRKFLEHFYSGQYIIVKDRMVDSEPESPKTEQ